MSSSSSTISQSSSQLLNAAYARYDAQNYDQPTNRIHGLCGRPLLPQACINQEDEWGQFVDFDDEEVELDRRAKFLSIRGYLTLDLEKDW
jgi:hypothetical protein